MRLQSTIAPCSSTSSLLSMQVALHDLRNLTKRLHVLEHHAEEVFQIGCALLGCC